MPIPSQPATTDNSIHTFNTQPLLELLTRSSEMVKWVADICIEVVSSGAVPVDWKRSWMVNVYKGKGNTLECSSYRGVKLLECVFKVLERVIEARIRKIVKIDEMQFGFNPGKGTTDAIFIVRQIQEKFLGRQKL